MWADAAEAARAWDAAAFEHWGREAILNFPEEHGLPPHAAIGGERSVGAAAGPSAGASRSNPAHAEANDAAGAPGAVGGGSGSASAGPGPARGTGLDQAAGTGAVAGGTSGRPGLTSSMVRPGGSSDGGAAGATDADEADEAYCVSDSDGLWTSDDESDCDLRGMPADWDSPREEEAGEGGGVQAVWDAKAQALQDTLVAAALEASAMPVPQLRAHVAALGRRVEEERAINPYVAIAEESLQEVLQPDTLAEALLAAVSKERQEAGPPDGGGFPAALAEAAELSRRCAGGPAEAVTALHAALARCDAALLAAHTDVDTPLLLNTLLAAAQGIPVAETLPSNQSQEQEDSPLTGCLKELESELLADRRIPDDPVQSNRLQAVQKLALLDVDLQPRLLQAAMRSVVSQRFPNVPLPPPLRPKPLGPQRPLHETSATAAPSPPPASQTPGQPTPDAAFAGTAASIGAGTSAAKTRQPPPAAPRDVPAQGLGSAAHSNEVAGGSAAAILGDVSTANTRAQAGPDPPCIAAAAASRPPSQFELDRSAALAFMTPERFPTPTDAATRLFGSLVPPPSFSEFRRAHKATPSTPGSAETSTPYTPYAETPSPALQLQGFLHTPAPCVAAQGTHPAHAIASSPLLAEDSSASIPTAAAASSGPGATPGHASSTTTNPGSGSTGSGRRYLQFAEPEGLPTLEQAPRTIKDAFSAMARRQRERLLQRKPHLRALSQAGQLRAPAAGASPSPGHLDGSRPHGHEGVAPPGGSATVPGTGDAPTARAPAELTAEEEVLTQRLAQQLKQMVMAAVNVRDESQHEQQAQHADGPGARAVVHAGHLGAGPLAPPTAPLPPEAQKPFEGEAACVAEVHSSVAAAATRVVFSAAGTSEGSGGAPKGGAARVIRRGGKLVNVKPRGTTRTTRSAARMQAMRDAASSQPQPNRNPGQSPETCKHAARAPHTSADAPSTAKRPAEDNLTAMHASGFPHGWDEGNGVTAIRISDASMHAHVASPDSAGRLSCRPAPPVATHPAASGAPLVESRVAPEDTSTPTCAPLAARGSSFASNPELPVGAVNAASGVSAMTAAGAALQGLAPETSATFSSVINMGGRTSAVYPGHGAAPKREWGAPPFLAGVNQSSSVAQGAQSSSARGRAPALRTRAAKPPLAPHPRKTDPGLRAKPTTPRAAAPSAAATAAADGTAGSKTFPTAAAVLTPPQLPKPTPGGGAPKTAEQRDTADLPLPGPPSASTAVPATPTPALDGRREDQAASDANRGDPVDGWEVFRSVMEAKGSRQLGHELEALGDLFGFPSASRFTEEWLEDAEGAHGAAYREAVAERLAKLRRIMRDGDPMDSAEAVAQSAEVCTDYHKTVAAWVARVRPAVEALEQQEADDHARRSAAHLARFGTDLPPQLLLEEPATEVNRDPTPVQLEPTPMSVTELESFQRIQEQITSGSIECMKG